MKFLEGDKIILRPLETKDIDLLYAWENNTEIWHVSNTLTPVSKYQLQKYIEFSQQDIYSIKQLRLIIEIKNNTAIGAIDLFNYEPYHQRAGIGIIIANKKEQKKGYADDALKTLIYYCFSYLRLNQLYCNIEIDNLDSINLFKKNGFVISGEKLQWNKAVDGYKNEYFLQLLNTNMSKQ